MGCSKCKEKKLITPEVSQTKNSIDRWGTWIIVIWFFLGCYGLFSLIKDLLP